jgi:hypothetical protein
MTQTLKHRSYQDFRDDFRAGIATGVYDAVWHMIRNGTDMPCADFYDTIGKAVERAIGNLTIGTAIVEKIKRAQASDPRFSKDN